MSSNGFKTVQEIAGVLGLRFDAMLYDGKQWNITRGPFTIKVGNDAIGRYLAHKISKQAAIDRGPMYELTEAKHAARLAQVRAEIRAERAAQSEKRRLKRQQAKLSQS